MPGYLELIELIKKSRRCIHLFSPLGHINLVLFKIQHFVEFHNLLLFLVFINTILSNSFYIRIF